MLRKFSFRGSTNQQMNKTINGLTSYLVAGRRYPVSYLIGECRELIEALISGRMVDIREELGDVVYAVQMLVGQRTGWNFTVRFADGTLQKFHARRAVWSRIFEKRGVEFSTSRDYLKNGSNYCRPHKVQAALQLAGHRITMPEAMELSELAERGEI